MLTKDEKESIIEYLKICKRVSHNGKYEILANLPSSTKEEMRKLFSRLRDKGIFAFLSRSDELYFKGIVNWAKLNYSWEEAEGREPTEKEKVRGREWMKCIETIMSKKRAKGDGLRMAEQAINHMNKDFYKEA